MISSINGFWLIVFSAVDFSLSSVFNSGRTVEEEGEFEKILACNQETTWRSNVLCSSGSLLPLTVIVVLCHIFLI